MRIFSFLSFFKTTRLLPAADRFERGSVVVASGDASKARQAVLAFSRASVLRSVPTWSGSSVTLEVCFPAGQGDAVMARIRSCVPGAETSGVAGCVTPAGRSARYLPIW